MQAIVPVKSAWTSKINWGQALGMIASVLVLVTGGKIDLDLATQAQIIAVIQGLVALYTWIMRTWFTASVTPSSVTPAIAVTSKAASAAMKGKTP